MCSYMYFIVSVVICFSFLFLRDYFFKSLRSLFSFSAVIEKIDEKKKTFFFFWFCLDMMTNLALQPTINTTGEALITPTERQTLMQRL